MLARLQIALTLFIGIAALGWLLVWWRVAPWLAIGGAFAIAAAYIALLGLEFLLLWRLHGNDPAPKANWRSLLVAWVGESLVAPQIFCWRQPFCSQAIADEWTPAGKRGVVLIHGFFCNRGFWNPWLRRLQQAGHPFVAINLEPVFASIDDYVVSVDKAVADMTDATGMTPIVVCHSMGGLVARAWLKAMKAEARVHRIITIGTPHRGTWLARFGRGANGRQMRLEGDWHTQLDIDMPASRHALFTCWYSNCDNIVFPPSNATLEGADNRLVKGAAHVQMAFLAEVMDDTFDLLDDKRGSAHAASQFV
ncbi:MAG: alpha/beta fold hydrolase [Polaromonas sp.]|nr:alpha/beta fold hydrolase [Polaromonas sp.]